MNSGITFYQMQLIEESQKSGERYICPKLHSFQGLKQNFNRLENGTYYEVKTVKDEKYIWFVFDYGKPRPLDEELTNIHTGGKRGNPRNNDEVEITKQFFVFYNFLSKILFISNSKKNIFNNIIGMELEKKFIMKSFFKNKDEFISMLKSVEGIHFTEAKNLFNHDSKRRQALIDLTGTDAPDSFSLEAKYDKQSAIIEFISNLISEREKAKLKSFLIKGTDENNLNFIFNVESFSQIIEVECTKLNNGKYDDEYLMRKIVEHHRVNYER